MIPENETPAILGTIPPPDIGSAIARAAELMTDGPAGLNDSLFSSPDQLTKALQEQGWTGCHESLLVENSVLVVQRLCLEKPILTKAGEFDTMEVLFYFHPGHDLRVLDARAV